MKARCSPILILTIVLSLWLSCNNNTGVETPGKKTTDSGSGVNSTEEEIYSMTYAERAGEKLFDKYCVICHGQDGHGDGFNSYNLDPRPRNLADSSYMSSVSDLRLNEVISRGGRGTGKSVLMPAYENTLNNHEIDNLVYYIRHLAR